MEDEVFRLICRSSIFVDSITPLVISVPSIAKLLGESKYKVRKCVKSLEAKGLVKLDYEGGYSEFYDCIYCYKGYCVTEAGEETEMYKEEESIHKAILEDIFS